MSSNNQSGASNVAETLAAAFGQTLTGQASYKTMTSWSQNNFSIIAKIVQDLKRRHLDNDCEPLTLEDILDETFQADISARQKKWLLENEVLEQNPRIRVIKPEDEKDGVVRYQYRPVIDVKGKKELRKYLMDRYQSGEGAVWKDDIMESIPHARKVIASLQESGSIVVFPRQDKKEIVFYNESKDDIEIDDDLKKEWRSISVEGVTDDKIEEYLEKHGIQSIQNMASTSRTEPVQKRRRVMRRGNRNFKSHNEHMKSVLEDYSEQQQ